MIKQKKAKTNLSKIFKFNFKIENLKKIIDENINNKIFKLIIVLQV